jgi:hypothetical protein
MHCVTQDDPAALLTTPQPEAPSVPNTAHQTLPICTNTPALLHNVLTLVEPAPE